VRKSPLRRVTNPYGLLRFPRQSAVTAATSVTVVPMYAESAQARSKSQFILRRAILLLATGALVLCGAYALEQLDSTTRLLERWARIIGVAELLIGSSLLSFSRQIFHASASGVMEGWRPPPAAKARSVSSRYASAGAALLFEVVGIETIVWGVFGRDLIRGSESVLSTILLWVFYGISGFGTVTALWLIVLATLSRRAIRRPS
jgi:hypothetical protein